MIDIVTVGAGGGSVAWVSPEGASRWGRARRRRPGAALLRPGRHRADADRRHPGPRAHPAPPARRRDPARRGRRRGRARGAGVKLGSAWPPRPPRGSEIWAWNQANAIRQATVRRGIDVHDLALSAFGGSGPLAVCRLLDVLGLPAAVVPPDPGNLCALGLLTVDVQHRRRRSSWSPATPSSTRRAVAATWTPSRSGPPRSLDAEGFDRPDQRFLRSADLRYDGQAFEVRVPVPDGPVDAAATEATVAAFHDAHQPSTATASATTPPSRSSGSTSGSPASARSAAPPSRRPPSRRRSAQACRTPDPGFLGPLNGRVAQARRGCSGLSTGPPASTLRVDLSTQRSIAVTIWAG